MQAEIIEFIYIDRDARNKDLEVMTVIVGMRLRQTWYWTLCYPLPSLSDFIKNFSLFTLPLFKLSDYILSLHGSLILHFFHIFFSRLFFLYFAQSI